MDHSRELPQGDFYVSAIVEPKDLNPLTSGDAWPRKRCSRSQK